MPPPHLHVLGVDPGGSTGWCYMTVPRGAFYGSDDSEILEWDYGEFNGPETEQVQKICRLVREIQSLDFGVGPAVVCEDFDIPPHAPTTDPELLSPVRIAAMLAYACFRGEMGPDSMLMLQGRSIAKSTATDDRLKTWGFYDEHSGDHARDATRHAITALRRAKDHANIRDAMWADPARPRAGRLNPAEMIHVGTEHV